MSNHVNKVSQQSSQQQINCSSRQTHHQKDPYWNQMRSSNLTMNVSQSHHVSECSIDRLEQDGPTIINSCKLNICIQLTKILFCTDKYLRFLITL